MLRCARLADKAMPDDIGHVVAHFAAQAGIFLRNAWPVCRFDQWRKFFKAAGIAGGFVGRNVFIMDLRAHKRLNGCRSIEKDWGWRCKRMFWE